LPPLEDLLIGRYGKNSLRELEGIILSYGRTTLSDWLSAYLKKNGSREEHQVPTRLPAGVRVEKAGNVVASFLTRTTAKTRLLQRTTASCRNLVVIYYLTIDSLEF
jgi:hypothetical protein